MNGPWTDLDGPSVDRGRTVGARGAQQVKPAPFAYHRAHSVGEAVALLAELGDEAKILAGGLSLVPMMNFRLARPAALIDVTRIEGLSYLRTDPKGHGDRGGGLRIGALTTHRAVEISRDPAVLSGFGVLPRSARWIGHYPIRSRGTFGGSIAHADPASEWCLVAVLLNAQVVLTGPEGQRSLPAAEFFQGYYTTAASPDEMITELWFPQPAPRAVLTEFAQRQGDFAIVAAAVSAEIDDGVCRSGRVVLGGVGPQPVQVDAGVLAGQPVSTDTWRAMGEYAASQIDPPDDTHGSGEYRRKLTATLVSRALAEASELAEAGEFGGRSEHGDPGGDAR
jgi:aerobic carbon-monoxide dehydrogenase medium subunit